MAMIKGLICNIRFNKKRKALIKDDIFIEKGVQINNKTKLETHIKIYAKAQILNTEIGRGTYVGYNSVLNNCIIGAFCSIASNVNVIYGRHPVTGFISTHPAFFSKSKQSGFSFTNEDLFVERKFVIPEKEISVIIKNDVWIGFGASVMEGVEIGDGAIVAANALVTKDVPPYAIVAGIPAKVVKYRFSSSEIEKLLKFKWWNRDFSWIKENYKQFNDISNFGKLIDNGKQ